MSFTAPLTFYQLAVPPHDPANFEQQTMMAEWVRSPGKSDQQLITITMESHDGSLDGYEMISENELRNQTDGVFVKKKELTKLTNGMPAYWQELSVGSGFDEIKRFDYVWVDGVRGVVLAITARYGTIDEPAAKIALANASGVLYPKYRY